MPCSQGQRDVLGCLPGADRPPGLASRSGRAGMIRQGASWGKGETVVTGAPGLLFFLFLLSFAAVFPCGCYDEDGLGLS